jgi:hypothetical protein
MYKLLTNLIPESYSNLLLQEFSNFTGWQFTNSASNVGNNYDTNDINI